MYNNEDCYVPGLSSLGVPGHPDFGRSETLFQPGGTDYAHLITAGTPGFSDLPTALCMTVGRKERPFTHPKKNPVQSE